MHITVNQKTLSLNTPRIMGILNVTPDSFSDGGRNNSVDKAIDHAATMIDAGASIIDIGGESTRPGASAVSEDEEAARVIPVIMALAERFDIFISVNTSKVAIITEAEMAGAHIINDVRSLSEPGAIEKLASSQMAVCLMHIHGGALHAIRQEVQYDVVAEVDRYFLKQITRFEAAGIKRNRLLLDPGFGFGKDLAHNYQLLNKIGYFHYFGLPLLVGMSRKSMIGKLTFLSPKKLIAGSIACAVIAAMQGVQIIRVHDVRQTVEAMHVVTATLAAKKVN